MIRTANKVALYARFSSDNQRTESIDAQIRAMEAYCKQHQYIIVKTYTDEAKSATTDRRPAFQQMIADSSNHIFDILLVHKLDRFARNRYDSAVYKRELKKNGVAVHSVLENLDSSPESIIMESVLEGMSEYYSQNLAREVMKGMRETALQGKHTGGKPPLGYDVDPQTQKLIVNEQEADIVRTIYSMYSSGAGYSAILDTLHKSGYRTKKGNHFQKNSLYSILTNKKYQGLYVFNRSAAKNCTGSRNTHQDKSPEDIILIEGGCPQIIDTDTFLKVQARIQNNKHTAGRNNAKVNYLLSGKVRCKNCGRIMVGNTRISGRNKTPYSTYRCPAKRHTCTNKEIGRNYLETYIISLLDEHIFNTQALKNIIRRIEDYQTTQSSHIQESAADVQNRITELNTAISNIADAIAAGLLSDTLVNRLHDLEHQKSELELSLQQLDYPCPEPIINPHLILSEYTHLKNTPASPDYKAYLSDFLREISVGAYIITVTIKTGLGIIPDLDTTFTIRRQELYQMRRAL